MISVLKCLAIAALALGASSCAPRADPPGGGASVVAAFYPIADAARSIGGDRIRVADLTPPGVEPHDLELSTKALDLVLDADLVLYFEGFQPALDAAVADARGQIVDLSEGLRLRRGDPHVWLDPRLWARVVERIEGAIARVAVDATDGRRYVEGLQALDEAFEEGLASCRRDLIVTAHGAFGYLADRYGLRQESISGLGPEAEPDPRRLADLADLVRAENVTTVFTEELVSPKIAQALAKEAGVTTDVLDPLESEPDGGYTGAMRRNLRKLREALGCR